MWNISHWKEKMSMIFANIFASNPLGCPEIKPSRIPLSHGGNLTVSLTPRTVSPLAPKYNSLKQLPQAMFTSSVGCNAFLTAQ